MNKDLKIPSWNELKLEKIKHLLVLSTNSHKNQDKNDLVEAISIVDGMIEEVLRKETK